MWRSIRARLADKGIADPMRQFPHVHALLDYVESVWLESMFTGDPAKDRMARDRYYATVYAPDPVEGRKRKGQVRSEPPPGFRDKQQIEQQFDTAMTLLTGSSRRRKKKAATR